MQKFMKFLLCLCLLISSLSLTAQQLDQKQDADNSSEKEKKTAAHKMNIFKVNLTALPFKNYSFQYERVLHKKISAALGIRFMPSGNLPFKESLKDAANGDADLEKAINDAQLSNFSITPEFRFYTGKRGYGRGFYLAPYYRYAKFNADAIPISYDGGIGSKTINLKGDMTTHTGGLMIGAQWFLGKSVTLDWWIIGAHYGTGSGTFTGTPSTPFTVLEQNDIRQTIEDFDLPVGTLKAEVIANSAKAIFDGPWAGIRGAITIGFRF
jgi:Protein of unknown function (DUF3575)